MNIEERLAALEARARRADRHLTAWRTVAVLLASVAISGPLHSQGAGGVARAPFRVVGPDGEKLLEVSKDGDGSALVLYSGEEREAVRISATSKQSTFAGRAGLNPGWQLVASDTEAQSRLMLTAPKHPRFLALASTDKSTSVTFWEGDALRGAVGASPIHGGNILLRNPEGEDITPR